MSGNEDANVEKVDAGTDDAVHRIRSLSFWRTVVERSETAANPMSTLFAMKNERTLRGELVGTNATQTEFHVSNLRTPLGVYAKIKLRREDLQFQEVEIGETLAKKMCPDIDEYSAKATAVASE